MTVAINSYENFITIFKEKSGLDLKAYKQNQMERRIRTFMETNKYENFSEFIKALDNDRQLYDSFFKHLTINVSQFFRDTNQWKTFRELIVPKYLNNKKHLKIWSAGCSAGQEAYTLAINFLEYFPQVKFSILATDIDDNVLKQAKSGLYKQNNFISTPPEILNKYFTYNNNEYEIINSIKALVKFKKQNLITDQFDSGFDLIVCRNVVIYFTEDIKEILYKKFLESLNDGGILFTGSSEHLFGVSKLGLNSIASFFYQKS